MPSVADLVEEAALRALATPANIRLGQEIADAGGVEFVKFGPLHVTARVTGGQRRTVTLASTPSGLAWTCTCTKRPVFCKHAVAAALETWRKAPPRRQGRHS